MKLVALAAALMLSSCFTAYNHSGVTTRATVAVSPLPPLTVNIYPPCNCRCEVPAAPSK